MSSGRQSQRGGEGALQIQVAGDYIVGIDEGRAKEIATETARQVIADYTEEALVTVQNRIDELDARVVRTLGSKGQLGAFADPSFQRTIRKAQSSAASTERESDYDLLAAMLSDRAANPRDRRSMAGIDRAIEVVDLVEDDALRALTIFFALGRWVPAAGPLSDGLSTLERIMEQLLDGPLPRGTDWAEHLYTLGALRVETIGSLRDFDEFLSSTLEGYTAAGVIASDLPEFVDGFEERWRWSQFTMDHELRPGYVRLSVPTFARIRRTGVERGFPEDVIAEVERRARDLFGMGTEVPEVRAAFMDEVRARPSLAAVGEWWAQFPWALSPTSVGTVLATANAFRLDEDGKLQRREEPIEEGAG